MSTDARALLAAVLEALDIPLPATEGDVELYDQILIERVGHAATSLRAAVHNPAADYGWEADYLRARLAEIPATGYQAAGGEPR